MRCNICDQPVYAPLHHLLDDLNQPVLVALAATISLQMIIDYLKLAIDDDAAR